MQNEPAIAPPNLLALPRDGLVQANIIHDFVRERVVANLGGCYGWLIRARYRSLLRWVAGRRIIDCGCGFGLFSRVALVQRIFRTIHRAVTRIAHTNPATPAKAGARGKRKASTPPRSLTSHAMRPFAVILFNSLILITLYRKCIAWAYDGLSYMMRTSTIQFSRCTGHLSSHKESNDRTPGEIAGAFRKYRFEGTHMQYENIASLPLSGGLQRAPVPGPTRFSGSD
jgi:hypothetical protein